MISPELYIKAIGHRLARPDILFWTLPFMMVLLIVGTISQKELGILESQERYFSSFFYMVGFIPLPGGMTLIGVLFINLLAKFLFKSEWSWERAGTIISHFGVLVLVLGGGISYLTSQEGYIAIQEGQSSSIVEDYHQRMLVVRIGDQRIYEMPFESLTKGMVIKNQNIPFQITIDKACYNCDITARPLENQDGWTSPGKFMQLNPAQPDPQDEKNLTGIEFSLSGVGGNQDGKYLTFDKFPKPPTIKQVDTIYTIAMERAVRPLPFSITLEKFTRELHGGTDMAKAFQSRITVTDENGPWSALIEMNEPLRYKGYTLYQSSFDLTGGTPQTVLAVVQNKGRMFPYISTCIIAFGLILHLVLRMGRKKENA